MFQFSSGSILGRYELLVPVARGGMAEVWAARLHGTRGFTKLVAIKTIRTGSMDDTRLEQMLLAEAQLASLIQHPNVVSTIELGEQDGTLFLVMEWADAEPLSFLLKDGEESKPVPINIAVNIVAQACRGLHRAHELRDDDGNLLGVVHRDVSPQNVLVTYLGVVKLVDFGIAKATQRASSMTEDGEVKGKLAYMSPEQVRGADVDRRTDLFALGTILYLLTTGQHPFKGSHPGETLAKLCASAPVVPPSRLVENYPSAVEAIVTKALRKQRDERFDTAEQMMKALYEAVPEAQGIDAEVAQYLNRVSAGRGEQRRRHIRTAGELLDRGHELSIQAQTSTSLSAMSIARDGTHSIASLTQTLRAQAEADKNPVIIPRTWLFAGTGLAAALSIAVFWLAATRGPTQPAAAGQPVTGSQGPTEHSGNTPPPFAATPEPKQDLETDAGADDTGSEQATGKKQRSIRHVKSRPAVRAKRQTGVTPATPKLGPTKPATESPTNAAAAEPPKPAPGKPPTSTEPQPKQVDSWDPTTFGGRL